MLWRIRDIRSTISTIFLFFCDFRTVDVRFIRTRRREVRGTSTTRARRIFHLIRRWIWFLFLILIVVVRGLFLEVREGVDGHRRSGVK